MLLLLISFLLTPSLKQTADWYLRAGNLEKAQYLYEHYLSKDLKDRGEVLLKLAEISHHLKNNKRAKKLINSSVPLLKDKNYALFLLGKIYFEEGDLQKARKLFENSKLSISIYYLGLLSLKEGEIEEATAHFSKSARDSLLSIPSLYGIALSYAKENKYNESLAMLNRLPDIPSVLILRGIIYYKMTRYERALGLFERAKFNFGIASSYYKLSKFNSALSFYESDSTKEAKFFSAECAEHLKKWEKAIEYYQDIIKSGGNFDTLALYGIGWAYYMAGNYSSTVLNFKRFIALSPPDSLLIPAKYRLARALFKLGNFDKAIYHFTEIVEKYPSHNLADDSYYLIGRAYFLMKRYENTLNILKEFIKMYPESRFIPNAIFFIGNSYFEKKDYRRAISYYKKIKNPTRISDDAKFRIELCYLKLGRYKSMVQPFERFVDKYPSSERAPEYLMEIGDYYAKRRNFWKAIASYRRIIEDYGWTERVWRAWWEIGECEKDMGNYGDAIDAYKKVLSAEPPLCTKARMQLGDIYLSLNDYEGAVREYQILCQDYPSTPEAGDALYKTGLAYLKLGKPLEARMAFQQFLVESPQDPIRWKVRIKIAETYNIEGDMEKYVKALSCVSEGAKGKERVEAVFLLGDYYFELEDFEKAKETYEKVLKMNDANIEARAFLLIGQCEEKLMNKEEAVSCYRKVIELSPGYILEEKARKGIERLGPEGLEPPTR